MATGLMHFNPLDRMRLISPLRKDPKRMTIGQSITKEIEAKPRWNETGIQLVAGEEYEITASGTWVDLNITHGPDGDPSPGWYMRLFEGARRMPHENWFALIGALDSDQDTAFKIGSHYVVKATQSGQLCCYANDVPGFYWNNKGTISLQLTRTA